MFEIIPILLDVLTESNALQCFDIMISDDFHRCRWSDSL